MAIGNTYQGILKYLNTEGKFDVIYPITYANLIKIDDEGNFLDGRLDGIDNGISTNASAIKAINDGADKAKGFVKLDDKGLVPAAFIPAQFKEVQVVATIAARDAIANPFTGMSAFVEDASGDTTVNSGGAYYIYNGTAWVKTAEAESMDVVLQWTAIQGKPDTLAGYGITDGVNSADVVTTAAANKILKLDQDGKLPADVTGNAGTASKLQASVKIGVTGDDVVAASSDFDGSTDVNIEVVLSDTGVTAGSYAKVTVDAKGRVTAGSVLTAEDIPNIGWEKITSGKPETLAGYGITDGVNKAGDTMTGALILSGAPAEDLQAATKAYVDSVVQGLDIKESVRCASVENITLSGVQTIDGVALAVGDRVLVKSQTNAAENGIYVVAEEAWTRAVDATNGKISSGMFTFVEEGNVNANSGFVLATDGAIAVGTTELQFSQFSGMGQVLAGTGIGKNGNEIYIKDTGVTAGTYTKLTVNAQGQVTAATNLTPDDLPEIAWAVITGKPTSTVEDIDDAVAKKHAHANSAQLDKVGEADGNLTYDSKAMATQEFVQSMIQVSPTEPANLPVGGVWIQTVEDTPQGN